MILDVCMVITIYSFKNKVRPRSRQQIRKEVTNWTKCYEASCKKINSESTRLILDKTVFLHLLCNSIRIHGRRSASSNQRLVSKAWNTIVCDDIKETRARRVVSRGWWTSDSEGTFICRELRFEPDDTLIHVYTMRRKSKILNIDYKVLAYKLKAFITEILCLTCDRFNVLREVDF